MAGKKLKQSLNLKLTTHSRKLKSAICCEDLEGYHSLWDTSFVPSKQAAKKAKGLEELSQKCNFSPSYLKRN